MKELKECRLQKQENNINYEDANFIKNLVVENCSISLNYQKNKLQEVCIANIGYKQSIVHFGVLVKF